MLPWWSGCSATKRSQAVTKQAILVFMSAAPRPYNLPSRSVGSNGSESHFSTGPVGTTSVCPAKQTTGACVPRRNQMFLVSPKWSSSAAKPILCRRSASSFWQSRSSGVTDGREINALASSRGLGFGHFLVFLLIVNIWNRSSENQFRVSDDLLIANYIASDA